MWEFAKGCLLAAANYGLFYLVSVLISRWLGASEFGDYSVAVAVAGICTAATTLGMDRLCLKKLPVFKKERQAELFLGFILRGAQAALLAGTALFLLFFAGSALGSRLSPSLGVHLPMVLAVLFVPVMGLSAFWSEVLNANGGYVLSTGINRLLLPGCVLACLYLYKAFYLDFSAKEAVLAVGLSWSLCLGVTAFFLRKRLPDFLWSANPLFETRAWFAESYAFVVNTMLLLAIQRSGVLVLELVHSSESFVGIYAAAAQISSFVIVFVMLSNRFFLPRISTCLKEKDTQAINRMMRDRFWALLVVAGAIATAILVMGKTFLGWFSPEFCQGYAALCVLAVGAVGQTLLAISPMLWQFMGYKSLVMKSYAFILVSACLGVGLGAARWGLMGAALGHAVPFLAVLVWLEIRMVRQKGVSALGFIGIKR